MIVIGNALQAAAQEDIQENAEVKPCTKPTEKERGHTWRMMKLGCLFYVY